MPIILQQQRSFNQLPLDQYKSPALETVGVLGDYRDILDLSTVGLRIPAFITSDYQKYDQFIKAYYSWLSLPDQAVGFGRKLLKERDVSSSVNLLFNYKTDYLRPFPATIAASLPLTTQHSKELYSSKGSALGVFSFFKALYNEQPEVIYPRERVLKPSSTLWIQSDIINVSNISNKTSQILGQVIRSSPGNAYAFVENITLISPLGANPYYQCQISDKMGIFKNNDSIIFLDSTGNTITETIITGVSGFLITDPGNWYLPGQALTLSDNPGVGFTGQIKEVSRAGISTIVISSAGAGYTVGDIISSEVYSKTGIQPTLSNPNHLYTYPVNSLGLGDAAATKVIDNLVTKGSGFRAIVSSVNGSGSITGVTVTNVGYGFERIPVLYVIPASLFAGTLSSITASTDPTKNTDIGKIIGIQIDNYGAYYPFNNNTNFQLSLYPISTLGGVQISSKVASKLTDTFYSISNVLVSIVGHGIGGLPLPRAASIQPVFGVIGKTKGTYLSDKATISGDQKLQDGFVYQDFSYIIKSGIALSTYRNIIKNIFHPAGLIVFGQVYVSPNLIDDGTNVTAAVYRGSYDITNSISLRRGALYRSVRLNIIKQINTTYFSNSIVSDVRAITFRNFPLSTFNNGSLVAITASISGNNLIVTTANGQVGMGQSITGAGVSGGTIITGIVTASGKLGTYTVNNAQTVSSTTMTAILTVPSYNNYPNTETSPAIDSLRKTTSKSINDLANSVEFVAKSPIKSTNDFTGNADFLNKLVTKSVPDLALGIDTISKVSTKPFYDFNQNLDTVAKTSTKSTNDYTPSSEFFLKVFTKNNPENQPAVDTITKTLFKNIVDSVVIYDNFSSVIFKQKLPADGSITTDRILLNLNKALVDTTSVGEYFKIILNPSSSSIINDSEINSSFIG